MFAVAVVALVLNEAAAGVWVLVVAFWALNDLSAVSVARLGAGVVTLNIDGVAGAGLGVKSLTVCTLKVALAFALFSVELKVTSAVKFVQGALLRVASVQSIDVLVGGTLAGLTWVKSLALWAVLLALVAGEAVAGVWVLVVAFGALDLLSALLHEGVWVAGELSLNIDGLACAGISVEFLTVSALKVAHA